MAFNYLKKKSKCQEYEWKLKGCIICGGDLKNKKNKKTMRRNN